MRHTDKTIKDQMHWYNADVYLPKRLMWLFVPFVLSGGAITVGSIAYSEEKSNYYLYTIAGLLLLLFGIAIPIWVKNQLLVMLSDDRFAYRTILGTIYVYSFRDINRIRVLPDSCQLVMCDGKRIHMEKIAQKSERLLMRLKAVENEIRHREMERINESLHDE